MILEKLGSLASTAGIGVGALLLAQQAMPLETDLAALEKVGPWVVCLALLVWLLRLERVSTDKRVDQIYASRIAEAQENNKLQAEGLVYERQRADRIYGDLIRMIAEAKPQP